MCSLPSLSFFFSSCDSPVDNPVISSALLSGLGPGLSFRRAEYVSQGVPRNTASNLPSRISSRIALLVWSSSRSDLWGWRISTEHVAQPNFFNASAKSPDLWGPENKWRHLGLSPNVFSSWVQRPYLPPCHCFGGVVPCSPSFDSPAWLGFSGGTGFTFADVDGCSSFPLGGTSGWFGILLSTFSRPDLRSPDLLLSFSFPAFRLRDLLRRSSGSAVAPMSVRLEAAGASAPAFAPGHRGCLQSLAAWGPRHRLHWWDRGGLAAHFDCGLSTPHFPWFHFSHISTPLRLWVHFWPSCLAFPSSSFFLFLLGSRPGPGVRSKSVRGRDSPEALLAPDASRRVAGVTTSLCQNASSLMAWAYTADHGAAVVKPCSGLAVSLRLSLSNCSDRMWTSAR